MKEKGATFALAVIGGTLGTLIANRFFWTKPVFTAREFRVVDENWKVRARLSVVEGEPAPGFGANSQAPALRLYDRVGNARVALFLHGRDPILALYGEKSKKRRLQLTVIGDHPGLWLIDEQGKIRASLGLDYDSEPLLSFTDKHDKLRAGFTLASGHPFLVLYDETEKQRAVLGYSVNPVSDKEWHEPYLLLLNKDEKMIWKAPQR